MNALKVAEKKLELLYAWKAKINNCEEQLFNDLNAQITAWRRLKEELEHQSLSSFEKQAKRISFLASCRKVDGDSENRLRTILIYETIVISMLYVKVLNRNNILSRIEEICLQELNIIDEDPSGEIEKHISRDEIEAAFKPYFEKIQSHKYDMLRECYEKIEYLYTELMKLHEFEE